MKSRLRPRMLYVLPADPARPLEMWAGSLTEPPELLGHMHYAMEVGVVLDGVFVLVRDGNPKRLQAGDAWLCAMWEHHRWWGEPACHVMSMAFLSQTVEPYLVSDRHWLGMFAAPPELRPGEVTSDSARRRLLTIAEEAVAEARDREPGYERALQLLLLRLLLEIHRRWVPKGSASDHSVASEELFHRVRKAVEIVRPGLGRRVSVAEAAKACGLSESHFHPLFRRVMGMTFGQFSLRSRIGFASNLLLTSSLTLEDIAESEGFTDASHLHRSFVRVFGSTPAEYRKKRRVTLNADGSSPLMAMLFCGAPQTATQPTSIAVAPTGASAS